MAMVVFLLSVSLLAFSRAIVCSAARLAAGPSWPDSARTRCSPSEPGTH